MKKRIFILLLAVCLISGLAVPVMAVDDTEMLGVLAALGVMNGDEKGNLNLSQNVTRAQFSKMVVAASVYGDKGGENTGVSPFSDVKYSHWAAGYVSTARDAGWVNGYLDGTFKPDKNVTLAEAVKTVEKLLGYEDADFKGTWPTGQMALARSLNLLSGITAGDNSALTRLECAKLVYNTLNAKTKSGTVYAKSLGYDLDANGNIDYLSLMNTAMEGPIVVTDSSWQSQLGFTPLHVYRNSADATIGSIQKYDLVYYSSKMSTIWAFNNIKAGTIDSILPSAANPTSIVVSGTTYELGTSAASYAVSNLGKFRVGDGVTLLIGRDDKVAAIYSVSEVDTTIVGVVTGTGVDAYVSASGDRYTKDYISIISTDGASRKFSLDASSSAKAGDIVSVSFSGDKVVLKSVSKVTLSGKVNSTGTMIGTTALSESVEILDAADANARKIAPSRIAGINLSADDILGCVKNSSGEIEKLILDDVTGDIHNYGVLVSKQNISTPNSVSFSVYYEFICGGVTAIYPSQNVDFGGTVGPVKIEGSISAPTKMSALTKGNITELSGSSATIGGNRFDLTASVQVYERRGGDYYLLALSEVNTNDYSLVGWYDALQSNGGRLRIIIATAK